MCDAPIVEELSYHLLLQFQHSGLQPLICLRVIPHGKSNIEGQHLLVPDVADKALAI